MKEERKGGRGVGFRISILVKEGLYCKKEKGSHSKKLYKEAGSMQVTRENLESYAESDDKHQGKDLAGEKVRREKVVGVGGGKGGGGKGKRRGVEGAGKGTAELRFSL